MTECVFLKSEKNELTRLARRAEALFRRSRQKATAAAFGVQRTGGRTSGAMNFFVP